MKEITRKLQRMGTHSYSVTLPKEFVTGLKWRERQKLTIEKRGDTLLIKDWKE